MTKDLRLRIVILQVVVIITFAFLAGAAWYAHTFTADQVRNMLEPQQITFPADKASGLPDDLQQYAGQQVLNGEQAHAYADKFIGLHLGNIGQGKPYSYWSGMAQKEQDAATKAKYDGIAQTMFRGETLRTMLNMAWAFWTVGDIAQYAALGLLVAAAAVLIALIFELLWAPKLATRTASAPAASA